MQVIDLEGDPRKHREGARKRGYVEEVIAVATGFSSAKDSLKDCVEHNSELSHQGARKLGYLSVSSQSSLRVTHEGIRSPELLVCPAWTETATYYGQRKSLGRETQVSESGICQYVWGLSTKAVDDLQVDQRHTGYIGWLYLVNKTFIMSFFFHSTYVLEPPSMFPACILAW